MTGCRLITRGFLAIWSQVPHFVTRSVVDSERHMCLAQTARLGSANQGIATHIREGVSDRRRARRPGTGALSRSDHEATPHSGAGGTADHVAAPSWDCDSVPDSAGGRFVLPSFVLNRKRPFVCRRAANERRASTAVIEGRLPLRLSNEQSRGTTQDHW